MHAENLAVATAAGRIQQPKVSSETAKRPAADVAEAPAAKRVAADAAEPPPPPPAPSTGGLSALQQMELFEQRLKGQKKKMKHCR